LYQFEFPLIGGYAGNTRSRDVDLLQIVLQLLQLNIQVILVVIVDGIDWGREHPLTRSKIVILHFLLRDLIGQAAPQTDSGLIAPCACHVGHQVTSSPDDHDGHPLPQHLLQERPMPRDGEVDHAQPVPTDAVSARLLEHPGGLEHVLDPVDDLGLLVQLLDVPDSIVDGEVD